MWGDVCQALVATLGMLGRFIGALRRVDFEAGREVLLCLDRPRMRGLACLAVAVVAVVQGVDAAREDRGPLRRSVILGERLLDRSDPIGARQRLVDTPREQFAERAPSLELRELGHLEREIAALRARGQPVPVRLEQAAARGRDGLEGERRRLDWAAQLGDLDRRAARGESVPPGWTAAAERASLIYEPDGVHLPYPPSFALLMVPATWLPLGVLRVVWYLLQVGLLAAVLQQLSRLGALWFPHWERWGFWLLGGTLVLMGRFLQRDLDGGQTNLMQAGLCVLALSWSASGLVLRAGVALGLAISIKLTSVVLLGWLLVRGQQRTALAGALAALALGLAPMAVTGPRVYLLNLRYWADGVQRLTAADPFAQGGVIVDFDFKNQSLEMMVHRYLRAYPSDRPDRPRWGYVDVGTGSLERARGATQALRIALVLLAVAAAGRRAPHPRDLRFWTEASLVLVLMLLFSPITWKAHLVALLLPVFVALGFATVLRDRAVARCLLGFAVLSAFPHRLFGERFEDLHLAYYGHTAGVLLVYAALLRVLWRLHRLPPSEEGLARR